MKFLIHIFTFFLLISTIYSELDKDKIECAEGTFSFCQFKDSGYKVVCNCLEVESTKPGQDGIFNHG